MGVLCRPSQVVRSPYVADIQKSPFDVSPFASVLKGEGAKLTGKEKSERKKKIESLVADLKKADGGEDQGGQMAHAPSLDCAGMLVIGEQLLRYEESRLDNKDSIHYPTV